MSKLEAIAVLCARECLKQQVGIHRLGLLLEAYAYGQDRRGDLPTVDDAITLARMIEPVNRGIFRRTPVTFADGGSAVHASAIPGAIERLFANIEGADPWAWVRAFLDIHPFTDGNGRTAFVLYNWLRGSFDDPVELPDFNAEAAPR